MLVLLTVEHSCRDGTSSQVPDKSGNRSLVGCDLYSCWLQALVQTALSDQAHTHEPANDACTTGPPPPSSDTPPTTDPGQGDTHAYVSQDHVAAMWLEHDLQSLTDVQVREIAKLLAALCLDGAVDLAWMQHTKSMWKMAVSRSIQQQSAHIAAKLDSGLTKCSSKASNVGAGNKVGAYNVVSRQHTCLIPVRYNVLITRILAVSISQHVAFTSVCSRWIIWHPDPKSLLAVYCCTAASPCSKFRCLFMRWRSGNLSAVYIRGWLFSMHLV